MGIFKRASLRKISLVPRGLRYKLIIAFSLMSIIPLLVAAYFVQDIIFPPAEDSIHLTWVLLFCIAIAFLGLFLAKQMIEPIVEMALEAKLIAEGDLSRRIPEDTEDEIGDIGRSINKITLRIKENMSELKSYGERTMTINTEIHRRILALSSLLQIGENISVSAKMEETMSLIIENIIQIMDGGYAIMFLIKSRDSEILEPIVLNNVTNDRLRRLEIRIGKEVLGEALIDNLIIYADSKTALSKKIEVFKKEYDIMNFAAFPIISNKKPVGMLLVGNDIEGFEFTEDDLELIRILVKQATITYESDTLAKRAQELAIKDDLTDLYNEKYITLRLDEEIKRAILYQRPCSYVIFNVDNFTKFRDESGELETEKALKRIALVLKESVTQIGRAARLSGDGFALLLPEKNKREAYRIAEEARKKVEDLNIGLDTNTPLTISGGVSENPLDGATAEELMEKANDAVVTAKTHGKNKIA